MPGADGAAGVHNEFQGVAHESVIQVGGDATIHLRGERATALRGLPARSPVFVGRETELAEITSFLAPEKADRSHRAVITGMPGVGKTELALQAAHDALECPGWFAGGLYADLAGHDPVRCREPGQILHGWLQALGIPEEELPHSEQERAGLYRSCLHDLARKGERVLIVVDNAATPDQMWPLLPSDGSAVALVTSRRGLDIGGQVYRIEPLSTDSGQALLAGELERMGAQSEVRIAAEPVSATRIAQLCGGAPLALRIVAGLLADAAEMSLQVIADDLARNRMDGLERDEVSVRTAFDLSYRLLRGPQARMFQLLAHAPGPDMSTGSAAVLVEDGEATTRRLLLALARGGMIDSAGQDRWRMHDLLREYASELGEPAAVADAVARLLDHLTATADAADDHLRALPSEAVPDSFTDHGAAWRWLNAEEEVLLSAVPLAVGSGHSRAAINLPLILAKYLRLRVRHQELLHVVEQGRRVAEEVGTWSDVAMLWSTAGETLNQLARYREAVEAFHHMEAAARLCGREELVAGAEDGSGVALRNLGDHSEAVASHTRAVAEYERLGHWHNAAKALVNKGNTLLGGGNAAEAGVPYLAAMELYTQLEDRHGFAKASLNMGNVYAKLGDHQGAEVAFGIACEYFPDFQDEWGYAMALEGRAVALDRLERHEESAVAFDKAIQLLQELGDKHTEARTWRNRAQMHWLRRDLDPMAEALEKAINGFSATNDLVSEGECWSTHADRLRHAGREEEALDPQRTAADLYTAARDCERAVGAWNRLAQYCQELTDTSGAADALNEARLMLAAEGRRREAVETWRDIAELYIAAGMYGEAMLPLENAIVEFRELGDEDTAIELLGPLDACRSRWLEDRDDGN